jgi:hypothetical protein
LSAVGITPLCRMVRERATVCLTVLGDPSKTMLSASAGLNFFADVGFKLREREVRLRRKIFSVAESRRRVVVTARPEDPLVF